MGVELAIRAVIAKVLHLVVIFKESQRREVGSDNASAHPLFLISSLRALSPKTSVGDPSSQGCGLRAHGTIIHFADLTAWSTPCS